MDNTRKLWIGLATLLDARSAEFMQRPISDLLIWMRVPVGAEATDR